MEHIPFAFRSEARCHPERARSARERGTRFLRPRTGRVRRSRTRGPRDRAGTACSPLALETGPRDRAGTACSPLALETGPRDRAGTAGPSLAHCVRSLGMTAPRFASRRRTGAKWETRKPSSWRRRVVERGIPQRCGSARWTPRRDLAWPRWPAYGPEKPIATPPGARTMATVTPSITRSGGNISSAPSRSAFSKAARVSATWI